MKKKTGVMHCPHCYFRVLPSKRGICPSCGKNVNDLSGIDPDRTILEIPDNAPIPDYCVSCGRPTKRRVEFHEHLDPDKAPTLKNFIAHAFLTASTPVYMTAEYGDLDGTTPTVILKVPQCAECAGKGKPKPVHVDFDTMSMTFIVHKDFKRKVDRARGRPGK